MPSSHSSSDNMNNANNSSSSSSLPYTTAAYSNSNVSNGQSKSNDTQFNSTDLQIGEGDGNDDEPPNRLIYADNGMHMHTSASAYTYTHRSSSAPSTPKLHNGINGHVSQSSSPVKAPAYHTLDTVPTSMLYVDATINHLRDNNSNGNDMNGMHSNGTSDADTDADHLYPNHSSLASTTSPSSIASISPPPPVAATSVPHEHAHDYNNINGTLASSSSSLGYDPSQRFDDNVAVQFNSHAAVSYVSPKLEARTGHTGCGM
jgi:hypothetical protein